MIGNFENANDILLGKNVKLKNVFIPSKHSGIVERDLDMFILNINIWYFVMVSILHLKG